MLALDGACYNKRTAASRADKVGDMDARIERGITSITRELFRAGNHRAEGLKESQLRECVERGATSGRSGTGTINMFFKCP